MPHNDLNYVKNRLQMEVDKRMKAEETKMRHEMMQTVGNDLAVTLTPVLKEIAQTASGNKDSLIEELKKVIKDIKIEVPEIKIPPIEVNVPDIIMPDIEVPKAQVDVKIPKIEISELIQKIKMPEEMSIGGWVRLQGVDLNNPLPVQLRDKDGKPVNLFENVTQIIGGGGGAAMKVARISNIENSAWGSLLNGDNRLRVEGNEGSATTIVDQLSGATWSVSVNDAFRTTVASNMINADDRLRVSLETGSSGLTDTELRASSVPVSQASGAVWSVSVNDAFRTTAASNLINADDRLRVSLETGGSGLTDSELRATAVPVSQLSGAVWSVSIPDSVLVNQVSGSIYSTNVTQLAGNDIATNSGVTNAGTMRVVHVTDVGLSANVTNTVTVSATDLDIRDLVVAQDEVLVHQVSGSNWSVNVVGALATTVVIGDVDSDVADTGEAPVKIGGIARTANPTAVGAGDRVSATFDDVGRLITYPYQVRDLIATARASVTTGIETTLLAGASGVFHDCVMITFANQSGAVVDVDIRDATGGGIVATLTIPADATVGWAPAVPYPQNTAADTWTFQNAGSDQSNTTIVATALFIKNV